MSSIEDIIARAVVKAPIDGDCPLTEYLSFNAADAAALGVILTHKTPKGDPSWHWYSDIAYDEQDDTTQEIGRRVAVHLLTALDAAGWVLAPKEPTDEMLSALAGKLDGWVDDLPGCDNPDLYRALLASRPKP